MNPLRITIAGASGYVGQALIPEILAKVPHAEITALCRSQQATNDSRVTWKACDLFSLKQLEEKAPSKFDVGIYLVHSMGPTAHLDQGTFADYDLILADNFARVAQKAEVKHIIYLGGLIPDQSNLSPHLRSRLEVEETFRSYRIPTTVFRAGIIVGEGGSSTQILFKLVKRLPVMICPAWTKHLTSPVLLSSVVNAIVTSLRHPEPTNQVFDLSGCKPLTYLEMMKQTARRMGKRRLFIPVPFVSPYISRLWVSVVTNSPKNLVYPLIESLKHPMVAKAERAFYPDAEKHTYSELLAQVSTNTRKRSSLFRFKPKGRSVRSVQRLVLPSGRDAAWVKERYVEWLPRFFRSLIKVAIEGNSIVFYALHRRLKLLELLVNHQRSTADRQLLYLGKGLMISRENVGRLEFRVVLNRKYVLAAIHDYQPALPWYLYRLSQSLVHLGVMRSFGRYLAGLELKRRTHS